MSEIAALDPFWGILFFFVLGSLLGSFGNVVIYRLPQDESVVRPRSRCNSCKKMIPWYDNIPIASWLVLRGRCRSCGANFSFRYPFVEFLTGLLFAIAFALQGWTWTLPEHLIFIWGLVVCTFIDIDHMILPDEFTLGGIVIGLLGAALNPERAFLDAFFGVLLGGGFLWFMAWLYHAWTGNDGMGGGDIKLLGWVGAVMGARSIPFVIIVSAVFGAIIGLFLARKSEQGLKAAIPYGPFLAAASLIYLLAGQTLARDYWSLFMPF